MQTFHLTCYVPPQVLRDFSFPKKATKKSFHRGLGTLGENLWGEVQGGANDQIMSR